MKKLSVVFLSFFIALSIISCTSVESPSHQRVEHPDWATDVKVGINDMLATYGIDSDNYKKDTYVVFDFDNTCSIFDVEEQLAIYQLETMSFAVKPDGMSDILFSGIGDHNADRSELGYGKGSYADWVDDITAAYSYLYDTYGPFDAKGLDEASQAKVQSDPEWWEFAVKMRAMYDLIYDAENAEIAYPWILYWFAGMTEDEVYNLAKASHEKYKEVETAVVHWESPADIKSKVGVVTLDWTKGIQVSENITELWSALKDNGIDVWVCSASGIDVVRAAVDAFGLHPYCSGVLAMTNVLDNGIYTNKYDYETGCGWYAEDDRAWKKMAVPEKAQMQGIGKVEAIANALAPEYNNHGPIAGFMDSTGDFNFCTEFKTLKLVICFNRASRKVTDGGGLIAEVAMYEKNTLGYDFAKADKAGDTLYLLQGRDENGLRRLRPSNKTITFGTKEEKLFKNADNAAQLKYMIDNAMQIGDIIDSFAIKTAADEQNNALGFKYGFLDLYGGYHKHP